MIDIKSVSFFYESGNQKNGLKDINIKIDKGEVVLLCGESGCGKTTLTRLINGLIPHYFKGSLSGEVLIDGEDIEKLPLYKISKIVGSVFQNPRSQFYCMDTRSEMAFSLENQGVETHDINRRIDETLDHLNMHNLNNRDLFKLSGGEKQKVAWGSVHTSSPDIIVLDEPSSNLDFLGTHTLGDIIEHWKSEGKTVVIAEHRLFYLRDIADRMIILKDGHIERDITLDQAKEISESELEGLGLRPLFLENRDLKRSYIDKTKDFITLENFNYTYKNGYKALNLGTIDIPKGEIIGIIGDNGAGKSTFAKCLCGINRGFRGKVRDRVFMVMQDVNHQLFTESVLDEVLLSMTEDNIDIANKILDSLNLLQLKDNHPMSLSGGQKQRVAIASALASDSSIIIFDEPTSGLDLKHMIQVSNSLKELRDLGKTILVITHDYELILRTCGHVMHLKKGRLKDMYSLNREFLRKLDKHFLTNRSISNVR